MEDWGWVGCGALWLRDLVAAGPSWLRGRNGVGLYPVAAPRHHWVQYRAFGNSGHILGVTKENIASSENETVGMKESNSVERHLLVGTLASTDRNASLVLN